jgi:hypothetical protein
VETYIARAAGGAIACTSVDASLTREPRVVVVYHVAANNATVPTTMSPCTPLSSLINL